jgi:nitrate reductase delta subunit
MLKPPANAQRRADAAAQVKAWTRARFRLRDADTIFVTELAGGAPGFPPLRTVVSFWIAERGHYHFTVFRPLEAASEADIPPAWFLDALKVEAGVQCGCC